MVLEAGLGGRLDSTNVIPSPALVVVTGIDYDHMAILGDTLAKIAAEKAGVIKPGTTVLFGEGASEAEGVIRETTERICGIEAYHRTDYRRIEHCSTSLEGTTFSFAPFGELHLSMLGMYQLHNAANVLTAIALLRDMEYVIPDEAVRQGLQVPGGRRGLRSCAAIRSFCMTVRTIRRGSLRQRKISGGISHR